MELKKNDIIELDITDMSGQGSGIGRYDGMAIFVPMTAVGDKINAKILKVKKNYAFAKIDNILVRSSHRVEPDCECYAKCGGCVYRHISYENELKIKQQRVKDAIERIGGIKGFEFRDIVGCENPDHYRNKSQIPIGLNCNNELVMGFYGNHSHRIINSEKCSLQPEIFNEIVHIFKDWAVEHNISTYDESKSSGILRHLYIRIAEKSGEIMVCVVINANSLPCSDILVDRLRAFSSSIVSIVLNINKEKTNVILGKKCKTIYGKDYITDTLCGLKFNISPLSFYQVNRNQAEKLYGIAADYADLSSNEFLLDLYCGTGTIGLSMASRCKKILGVEIIPQAVENAKENAKLNQITNSEFICADASKAAEQLSKSNDLPDIIVLDPPRKGCDEAVVNAVCKMSPKRLVYVSCDPETLARDIKIFDSKGYQLVSVTPVDMFPRTSHVETVVLMTKCD